MDHSCAHGADTKQKKDEQEIRIHEALKQVKNIILVMSGKGGVGKSTVAVNMAVALAGRGKKVGLMDVDLHGPSIPVLTGLVGARPESNGKQLLPIPFSENLKVLSIGNLLPQNDDAIIWRGPLKIGAIRQFVGDAQWGDLDYLIVDSPPGTGDEPLTVAQDFDGVRAVVVTTPQEVSIADVRKSLNFCKSVNMPVIGVIENMSGYVCSQCNHHEDLFGEGGGEKVAKDMRVPFLGKIPIDHKIVLSGDAGSPFMAKDEDTPLSNSYNSIVDKIEASSDSVVAPGQTQTLTEPQASISETDCVKFAVPTAGGILCAHFGHCEKFAILTVKEKKIVDTMEVTPPPHEPGLLPRWLAERGINFIIAGGMGQRAQNFFTEFNIKVIVGAPNLAPEVVVNQYLQGALETGQNVCDH